eukprot:GHRR01030985.1.p1 GENE.GHRR01030985.1~~GHRR01030985.1.p1  ORF type:complete len:472 (+),score=191.29 GHRR01030985.1:604-2019(+)
MLASSVVQLDTLLQDPLCSLIFNPIAVRDGYPCCHAYCPARDGLDLAVGIANGEVILMSLRSQLTAQQGSTRPIVAALLNADNLHDQTRCNAVLWVPKSSGMQFLAAHASGSILVYKKGGVASGEGGGKLLSQLSGLSSSSSRTSSQAPCQTINVNGGGINDAAFSPDGSRLAVACRDGTVRLLDWPNGNCVGGYSSYYGAVLCVCWSPNGALVASGGEDDLVAVYSMTERQVVAFGEGHTSYVCRVAFDHWVCQDTSSSAGPAGLASAPAGQVQEKLYRLGSVGQDTAMCLWDLVMEEDPAVVNTATGQVGGLKRVASQSQVNIPSVSSNANLAAMQQQQQSDSTAGLLSQQRNSFSEAGPMVAPAANSSMSGTKDRTTSGNLLGLLKQQQQPPSQGSNGSLQQQAPVAPSLPRSEMTLLPPVMQHRIHMEPVSDILFTEEAIFTACSAGQIKCWLRPELVEQLQGNESC